MLDPDLVVAGSYSVSTLTFCVPFPPPPPALVFSFSTRPPVSSVGCVHLGSVASQSFRLPTLCYFLRRVRACNGDFMIPFILVVFSPYHTIRSFTYTQLGVL